MANQPQDSQRRGLRTFVTDVDGVEHEFAYHDEAWDFALHRAKLPAKSEIR